MTEARGKTARKNNVDDSTNLERLFKLMTTDAKHMAKFGNHRSGVSPMSDCASTVLPRTPTMLYMYAWKRPCWTNEPNLFNVEHSSNSTITGLA